MGLLEFLFWFLLVIVVIFLLVQITFNVCLLPWQRRIRYKQREALNANDDKDEQQYSNKDSLTLHF